MIDVDLSAALFLRSFKSLIEQCDEAKNELKRLQLVNEQKANKINNFTTMCIDRSDRNVNINGSKLQSRGKKRRKGRGEENLSTGTTPNINSTMKCDITTRSDFGTRGVEKTKKAIKIITI
jgi:hypothetical protein